MPKNGLGPNCATCATTRLPSIGLGSHLLLLLRLDASQSEINPFTNPDPFAPGKQLTLEEQKALDTGLTLVRKHNEDGAIQWLKARAKDHPDHWRVWTLLSLVCLKQNRYQESVDAANSDLRKNQGDMNRVVTIGLLSYKGAATAK